jgi:hypothetical protein
VIGLAGAFACGPAPASSADTDGACTPGEEEFCSCFEDLGVRV